jgi:hypothetical protein
MVAMKRYYRILLATVATLGVAGCDDFLSKAPDNRAQLDSKEKVAELLVTAYPEANYMTFCEAMSDNAEDNPSATKDARNADPYFWRDGTSTEQDSPENYWNGCYAAIAASNHALQYIGTTEDPSLYNDQKGEALVARAYAHFMLVSLFAKMYNHNTAATDPGIPYVTDPETVSFKKYTRGTVQSVYDNIEKDLTEGLSLLNDHAYQSGGMKSFHFTKAAAHAFATRFYLFKKDYDKVLEHTAQVFPAGDFKDNMRPWNTTYRSYSANELAAAYTNSTENANLLLCETLSDWANTFNSVQYATGAGKYQEIFANVTGGIYAYSTFYSARGVYFVYKFRPHFVRIGTNANTGYTYTIAPLFTAEEVLLSRAEAYVMKNQFHEAMADINLWASTRIANYDPDVHLITFNRLYNYYGQQTNNQLAILSAILDFRRVEFLHEGLRWFDILRHKIVINHTTYDGMAMELKAGDPRRTLQIPREAVSMGGLDPNPR